MSKAAADTQTQSNSVAAGNSNFVAGSGTLSSSGLSAYSGPWYIETQTLDIEYVRVPREQYWNNTCAASLSGLTTTHSNIHSTKLICHYTASYDAAVVYQNFNSSSVQQPQEFSVIAASGDPNGVSYGTITSATLGPMGSIVTTQPYIRRVAYTSATSGTQPVVSKISTGSIFAVYDDTASGAGTTLPSGAIYRVHDGTDFFTDINFWSQYGNPVGNASIRPEKAKTAGSLYQIGGAYNTNKEFVSFATVIDQIASRITNEMMYAWPIPSQNSTGFPVADEGLPEYDKNRHA